MRRGESRRIGIEETVLDGDGLDGFAEDRAGFGIVVHSADLVSAAKQSPKAEY
jgi:hypothetical protein